jgi:hypothetical protein
VRKASGGSITLVAGDGTCRYAGDGGSAAAASLNQPGGVAVAANGAVYIADTANCRVRLVSGETLLSVAGVGTGVSFGGCEFGGDGGPAVNAILDRPQGVATDSAGNLYIADSQNHRIRIVTPGADADNDGVADASDNCPETPNAGQQNNDRNFIGLPHPRFAFDDLTLPRSDAAGDACDTDDDNDGLADSTETALGPGHAGHAQCPAASADTNPLLADTDGDRVLDAAECALGTDPASAASKPPAIVAPDADADGVPDSLDPNDASVDSDGDGVRDGFEFRNYNTSMTSANSDGDACADGKEMASINGDLVVTSGDLGAVASAFGPSTSGNYVLDFDVTKDGVITSGDLGFVASKFGAC